ncbi:MAG: 7-cyano-7-deazaguanine synthase, partial [Flavobacteriales bacterium]|nr:7-cyano-7-deazaguanine synthase [Flavobacteriales bacterium]
KPLLWSEVDGRFLFSSELRSLLALGAGREQDPVSARQYFAYYYIPAPHTVFKGSYKLLPGHCMHVDKSGVRVERWYDVVEASKQVPKSTDPQKTLFELMDDAVRLRLIADVPVGAFLSGGVDSSIVSALATRHHRHLHTFSIGYADDPFFDESRYAEEVARHIKSEHHTFKLTREELAADYTRLLVAMDEPFADSSALPSFMLCERTRKHVTVAVAAMGPTRSSGGTRSTRPNCAGATRVCKSMVYACWLRCGAPCPARATANGPTASGSTTGSQGWPARRRTAASRNWPPSPPTRKRAPWWPALPISWRWTVAKRCSPRPSAACPA